MENKDIANRVVEHIKKTHIQELQAINSMEEMHAWLENVAFKYLLTRLKVNKIKEVLKNGV